MALVCQQIAVLATAILKIREDPGHEFTWRTVTPPPPQPSSAAPPF